MKPYLKITKDGELVALQNIEGWSQEQIDEDIRLQRELFGRDCEIVTTKTNGRD